MTNDALEPIEEAEPIEEGALELDEDDVEVVEEKPKSSAPSEPKPKDPGKQQASIVVKDPEGHETTFALDKAVITMGRDESMRIVIPDKKASRSHCVIEMAGDFYNIIDSGSTNGTKVNGQRITQHRLCDQDVIRIGAFAITYHGPTDPDAERLATPKPAKPAEPKPKAPSPAGDTEPVKELPEPEGPDDSAVCPTCQTKMPENAPCEKCGYKSLKLRAQENFVDNIAPTESLLGGLGLWKLRRQKVLDQVFAMKDVPWVVNAVCDGCGKNNRVLNEFRVKCVPCEKCKKELKIPAMSAPHVD